eukprot:EG_transcript_6967
MQLMENFSFLLAFTVIPFLVEDFFPNLPHSEVGYWSGNLHAIFYIGQFVGSPLWGWLSDRIGRRPVLIMGMVGLTLSVAGFGICPTYFWALLVRFIWGFGCGNTPVIKAYVTEVTDTTTMGRAFGLLGLQWSIAQFFGPLFGGVLVRPAERYGEYFPLLKSPLFQRFPCILACCIPAVLDGLVTLLAILFLPESPDWTRMTDKMNGVAPGKDVDAAAPETIRRRTMSGGGLSLPVSNCRRASSYLLTPQAENGAQPYTMQGIFSSRLIVLGIVLYALTDTIFDIMDTLMPLWMVSHRKNGGFDFDSVTTGAVLAVVGPVSLIWQPLIFPVLVNIWGNRYNVVGSMVLFAVGMLVAPYANLAPDDYWVQVSLASLANIWAITATIHASCCAGVIVNNVSPPHLRGVINGITETLACAMQTVGPIIFSVAFAWVSSHDDAHWPLTHHSVFHVAALCGLGVACVSQAVGPAAEHPVGGDDGVEAACHEASRLL